MYLSVTDFFIKDSETVYHGVTVTRLFFFFELKEPIRWRITANYLFDTTFLSKDDTLFFMFPLKTVYGLGDNLAFY